MENDLFKHNIWPPQLRGIFFRIAQYAKIISVLGLLMQFFVFRFAWLSYLQHIEYGRAGRFALAQTYLIRVIFQVFIGVFAIGIYVLFYKNAEMYRCMVADENVPEEHIQRTFRLNLQLLQAQCGMIAITICYYSYQMLQ